MREFALTASGWVLHYLTHSVVMLPVIAATAWLGDRALRRVGPEAQHRLWVCALLSAIAAPMLPGDLLRGLIAQQGGGAVASTSATLSNVAILHEHWSLPSSVYMALAVTYLLSVLFAGARLLWRWRRTRQLLRNSTEVAQTQYTTTLIREAARRLAVAEPEVRCSPQIDGPVVLGVRRAVLLTPDVFFEGERSEDIAAALAHECAHIARGDFARNLVYESIAVLVAYHPVSWWMRRRIAETRELVCDETAAAATADRGGYAASLLRLATRMVDTAATPMNAIGVFDANILEERIMRLTTDVPSITNAKRAVLASVAACALLGGAASAAAMGFDVSPQTKQKIYKLGNGVSAPVLVHSVDAEFTPKARRDKVQGISVVSLIVETNGQPHGVHTVRKLNKGLDEKAIEAVQRYRFKPAMFQGKAVPVEINIEVNFHLY